MPNIGQHRLRQREICRTVKALSQAAKVAPKDVAVRVFRDGSFMASVKPDATDHPQAKLGAGKEISL
jgi:hypothetical protein